MQQQAVVRFAVDAQREGRREALIGTNVPRLLDRALL
jgi:hypothetical protein